MAKAAKAVEAEVQKEESKTELATVQGGQLQAAEAPPAGAWGTEGPINDNERLVPKLHLMQGMSQLVADEKAKLGDIVDLITGTVLGGFDKPVEIIPIMKLPSTWVVNDIVDGKRKYRETVPYSMQNKDWEWTIKDKDGKSIRENDHCINFLVMVTSDLSFPMVVTFKRTSVKAGKKLVNHFDRCAKDRVAPASFALKLLSKKEMKDKQAYAIFDIDPERRASKPEELKAAWEWYQQFKGREVRVDDSDLQQDSDTVSSGSPSGNYSDVNEQSQY